MANALYAKGKEKMLTGLVNFLSDTIKVALVKNDYVQNLTFDEFYTAISASVLGTPQTITGKSVTAGVFDAADVTFAAVPLGSTAKGVVIYKYTGDDATSPLLAYIDTITGFPLITTGGDVIVQWDNGAFKIFSL